MSGRRAVFSARRAALVAWHVCVCAAGVRAGNQLVQIDEVLAGANGDSRVQFVELKICCPGQNQWGPQGAEFGGRVKLRFFDAADFETGEYVFPADPPDHTSGGVPDGQNAVSVLVATQAFANLPGSPAPDFILPDDLLMAGGGKVCFVDNGLVNPNAQPVRLCLSYGNFAGSTGTDLGVPPYPAGPPASALPTTDASALVRFQHFERFGTQQDNADFHLAAAAPRNSAGQTGTIAPAPLVDQGQNLFFLERFQGNGRTCFSCHQPQDGFGLSPATVGSLPDSDPLFVPETVPGLAALENACLLRSRRAVILENIDGFDKPLVYRGSPHLLNIALTAPYGQSGEFEDLRSFSTGAVRQHFPRTLARNADPAAGPIDFREPSEAELIAMEAFMNAIQEPSDGNYDINAMIIAAVARGANASAIIRGRSAFNGAGKCFLCHSGPVLADVDQSMIDQQLVTLPPSGSRNLLFDTGVVRLPINEDAEVHACLGTPMPPEAGNHRLFNTPPLIGTAGTGPFFHDHSALTLREAVDFYNRQEFNQSPAGQLIGGIVLSSGQVNDITAFLNALRDPGFQVGPPVQLVIDPINPQVVGVPFNVAVRACDVNHNPSPVGQATQVTLTLRTGTGSLGGTLTGVIPVNASSVTFAGLTYSPDQKDVGLTATRTSGLALAPGNSNKFVVCPVPPNLTLTAPNGGQTIPAGSTQVISWTAAADLGELRIDLWKGDVLIGPLGTAASTDGVFLWDVCASIGDAGDYRIRIRQTSCHCVGCIADFSDGFFGITGSLPSPALQLTSPNGGEVWPAGSMQTVTWTSSGGQPGDLVSLELLKAGQPFRAMGTTTLGAGSFSWEVCPFLGDASDYSVRLTRCDCAGCTSDASDGTLSITGSSTAPSPTVTLTSPNGGELLTAGSRHTITWTSTNPVGDVAIELLSAGAFALSIGSAPMAGGQFEWDICTLVASGSDYTIRLTRCDCAGCAQDASDGPFSIAGASGGSPLTLTAPQGGEVWAAGSAQNITWTAPPVPPTSSLDLFLYRNGEFHSFLGSVPVSAGSFAWTICPFIGDGADYLVFARYFDDSCGQFVTDAGDGFFAITGSSPVPTLTLTSPNGGQTLTAGSMHTITWSVTNAAGAVKILLKQDGQGGGGIPVGSAPMSAGQFDWTLCSFIGNATDYRIRLEADCGVSSLADESDANFAITGSLSPPVITVTSPNGGQSLQAGSSQTVTWNVSGSPAPGTSVTCTLLKSGQPVRVIGAVPLSAGQLGWEICHLEPAGNDYRVQVAWLECGQLSSDTSNQDFTITQPALAGSGAGDFDGDCDNDAADLAILADCRSRANVPHPGTPQCTAADLDGDGDVDLDDFGLFQRRYRP